jgi:D-serine deaminase-like pyridoxal phosphate-dependent protein
MALPPPAVVGIPLAEVDTPALIVDLDAFERNLARMAERTNALGVRLRPHAKTHKSPLIAMKQIAHGAVGVCCQKVSEAEVLVAGGVPDVLVSNEVVGRAKLDRLAALSRAARVALCIDTTALIRDTAEAAERAGVQLGVLVEIDVGGRRCGIAPGAPAAELARLVDREPSLRFAGLQAYYGSAQHKRTLAERQAAIGEAGERVQVTLDALERSGLACETIGGAGTGTFELEGASGLWNELQPGSYLFMDGDYARNLGPDGRPVDSFEHALFLHVTVLSTNGSDRAVIDAGHKAVSNDSGFPDIVGRAGAVYHRPSDEHGVLDLARCNDRPRVGDKLRLIPGHCDPTVNLHDWYIGVRGLGSADPRVTEIWPVAARGAVF